MYVSVGSEIWCGKREFQYGRFEIRARIPTSNGSWPAIWTLGKSMRLPNNGEIDIMEYYRINQVPHLLANVGRVLNLLVRCVLPLNFKHATALTNKFRTRPQCCLGK